MKNASKKLLSIFMVLALMFSISATALAKTSSTTIDAPAATATVFGVTIGGKTIDYTWADMMGQGSFKTTTCSYGAKVDDQLTTMSWTGVLLADILANAEKQAGITLADDYVIKAKAADGYQVSFTVADVKDAANRYMVACDPVSNYDGTTSYANSYVRILRGDETTTANQANIRCLLGIEVFDASGNSLTATTGKTQGGDVDDAVFYIAIQESADNAIKYYYYTKADLQSYNETHTFQYVDHSTPKSVTAEGASLKSLLDDITDATITDDMIVQYAESDGYHADQSTPIDESSYKDKYAWLTNSHTDAGGNTVEAVNAMIAYGINEQYTNPDENNVNDPVGVYKDADDNSGYLRAYRQNDSANAAVIKYLMGVVVSYDGQLFSGKDGYQLEAVSSKNTGTAIKTYSPITGLVPGMQYVVKAPTVTNATLSAGQASYQLITATEGSSSIDVKFTYDEDTYFTVTAGDKTTNYVYTDFLISPDRVQVPTAAEGAAAMDATVGVVYGYYDTMLYRYNGIWLSDLLGDATQGTVTLVSADGAKTTINAADASKYFVAYNNTQSKSSTNVPEGKRVTKTYSVPAIIIPGDGSVVTAASDSTLIGEKGNKVTTVVAEAAGVIVGETTGFTDLTGYSWAENAINYLHQNGIVGGTSANTYAPGEAIKRGDFMLMLYRAFNLTATTNGCFNDVSETSYYYQAIATAKALGIAKGDGANFDPEGTISRQDAITLIYRTLQAKGIMIPASNDLSSFHDASAVSSYATDAFKTLVGAGIIHGSDGKLDPTGTMTRAQMAQILYNALTE